jgi:Replication-relaxation
MNYHALHQQRTENILLSLKKLDYLNRYQLQVMHNLKSPRNANRIINGLSEYISSFRFGLEKIYYLNKAGRERVQCTKIRKKTPNVQHYLLRNQFYIFKKYPATWENEIKLMADKYSLICDAEYREFYNGKRCFVEIDISQPMAVNKAKIDKYRKIKELTGADFNLIWVTELESRRHKLMRMCEGLPGKVYTLNDII